MSPEFSAPPFPAEVFAKLLALNNAHAVALSYETQESFATLLADASHVRADAQGLALLVAFRENDKRDTDSFCWLMSRFAKFLYIDRVVVSEQMRGRGVARRLYDELAAIAVAEARRRLVCEINIDPPNPSSDAFHQAMGFLPVGQQVLAGGGKTVRYWSKELS